MTKTAFVFPGQGTQFLGMGKESFEQDSTIRDIYLKADSIFASTKSISQVSFEGPEELLAQTLYTQPAILTLSIALYEKVKEQRSPAYVAGHSLGEFAALYAAGVLDLESVIKLVIKRADLMDKADPGAMAAVIGMEEAQLNTLVAQVTNASVANYNAPDQIVITGNKEAVAQLSNQIETLAQEQALKIRVIQLNVGGAFHSPLMKAASEEFAKLIDSCQFNDAKIPVIQNINAQPTTKAEELKANLKQQMTGSVQWTNTVKFLIDPANAITEICEIGPGKVLAGLIKKQERRFPVKNISQISELNELADLTTAAK